MECCVVIAIVVILILSIIGFSITLCVRKHKKKNEASTKNKGGGLVITKSDTEITTSFCLSAGIINVLSTDFMNDVFKKSGIANLIEFITKSDTHKPEGTAEYELFKKSVDLLTEAIDTKESKKLFEEKLNDICHYVNDDVYRSDLVTDAELNNLNEEIKSMDANFLKTFDLEKQLKNIKNESVKNEALGMIEQYRKYCYCHDNLVDFRRSHDNIIGTEVITYNPYLLGKYYNIIGMNYDKYNFIIQDILQIDKKYLSKDSSIICQKCYLGLKPKENETRYEPIIKYSNLRSTMRNWYDNRFYKNIMDRHVNKESPESKDHADIVPASVTLDALFALCVVYHSNDELPKTDKTNEMMIKLIRSYLYNIWIINCLSNTLEDSKTNKAFGNSFYFE